ncbi:MAG TPA: hypothetical protein VGM78_06710 [Ilumatobacteraceae bacterium]
MTKEERAITAGALGEGLPRCRWCRRVLPESAKTGRPRTFCRQACRQWDWVARQRARELQISENDLVVARTELDALRDDLYVLACAMDDVRRDLAAPGKRTERELRDSLVWLLDAAAPLHDREIASPMPPVSS